MTDMPSRCLPIFVGSVRAQTAKQLAAAVMMWLLELRGYGADNKPRSYSVGLDLAGRVVLDRLGTMPAKEWLMNVTRKTNPDLLADEIRSEAESRDKLPRKKRKVAYAG